MIKTKSKNTRVPQSDFDMLLLKDTSPFAVREAYKALRTNISFSIPGTDSKVLGVTSANRAEGKSATAINTAISFATLGKRVILVDCDMRLPSIANKLKLKGRPGLTDYLIGEATLTECMRSALGGMLDVMVSGSIPADPTGLLASEHIVKLIEKMKEHYDYVIIDFPPINTVTDAAILSKAIDGFMLVVRHNSTEYKQVEQMLKSLKLANANILGFVYNDAPTSDKGKYGYYSYGG